MKSQVKTKFHQYDEDSLKKAVEAVRNRGKLSEICRQYGVPKSPVQDRIKGKVNDVCKQMGPDARQTSSLCSTHVVSDTLNSMKKGEEEKEVALYSQNIQMQLMCFQGMR